MPRLPSLTNLRAFECAARHGSFTRAAQELFVTQGAISQNVKHLEEELGFKLFVRQGRQLHLTEDGNKLSQATSEALRQISSALTEIRRDEAGGILTVSTLPSFAMQWLIPRLGRFRDAHPEIDIRIHTEDRPVDFEREEIDMAVRYGMQADDDHHITVPLMKEQVFPVCSPRLLASGTPLKTPEDLRNTLLIHDETDRGLQGCGYNWESWFRQVGITGINLNRGPSYYRGHMVIQAAEAGQGVALTRTSLAEDAIRQGRLIRLFDIEYSAPDAYYVVWPKNRSASPKIRAMCDWLLEEAAKVGHPEPPDLPTPESSA